MRVIRLKIKSYVTERLKELSSENGIQDRHLVEDIFALLRYQGNGIPDEERQKAIAEYVSNKQNIDKSYCEIMVKKRAQLLKNLCNLNYFAALASINSDMVASTERLLQTLRKMNTLKTISTCNSCHLLNYCQFGLKYYNKTKNIALVVDSDYKDLVHSDCPEFPKLDLSQNIAEAIQKCAQLTSAPMTTHNVANSNNQLTREDKKVYEENQNQIDEDEGDSYEEYQGEEDDEDVIEYDLEEDDFPFKETTMGERTSKAFDSSFTGEHYATVCETLINNLSVESLDIFDLSKKLEMKLNSEKKGEYKPTEEISKSSKPEHIKSESELHKINATQHGLPEEVFYAKSENKSLQKREELKRETKSQLLYLLIDCSASMKGQLPNKSVSLTRGSLCSVFASAIVKRVIKDKGIVYLRYFASSASRLSIADTSEKGRTLQEKIMNCNYSGSGTNILSCISTASADIFASKADRNISKAEILCITDCDDCLVDKSLRHALSKKEEKIPLNVLDVSSIDRQGFSEHASNTFKKVADKYFKVRPEETDLTKMIELL